MEEAFFRFPHLPEQILEELDNKSLMNSRVVGIQWKNFIDGRAYLWTRFNKIIANLKEESEKCDSNSTPFHLTCKKGHAGIAELIMKNSARLNIDLNAKNNFGKTAFHYACEYSHLETVEILMKNSAEFNIDLNAKASGVYTAFHFACIHGKKSGIEKMIENAESCMLDLEAKMQRMQNGMTGLEIAQYFGRTDIVNLIKSKMLWFQLPPTKETTVIVSLPPTAPKRRSCGLISKRSKKCQKKSKKI